MRVWAMCALVACGGGSKHPPSNDAPEFAGDGPMQAGCPIFPANHIFNTRIDAFPVHPHSADFIATIGDTTSVHLDLGTQTNQQATDYYGIPSNTVMGNSFSWPNVTYGTGAYLNESDCSNANRDVLSPCPASPAKLPIPSTVLVEGGIQTDQAVYGDHHILMFDSDNCRLWETFHSYMAGSGFEILGSATWDLRSDALRPDGWTSADAAGFPIFPLLLRASEADAGAITHAVRFTVPVTRNTHVWPARHDASSTTTITVPPMGQLFRLKASYQIPSTLHPQSVAILTALKQYGMYLADNGSGIYIQGEPSASWADTTFSEVQVLQAQDFEAVDLTPITQRAGFDVNSGAVPP